MCAQRRVRDLDPGLRIRDGLQLTTPQVAVSVLSINHRLSAGENGDGTLSGSDCADVAGEVWRRLVSRISHP